jgi:hypothetical protein
VQAVEGRNVDAFPSSSGSAPAARLHPVGSVRLCANPLRLPILLALDAATFQSNPRAVADLHAAEAAFWRESNLLLKAAQTFRRGGAP